MVEYFTREFFDEMAKNANNDSDFQAKAGSLNVSMVYGAKDKDRWFLVKIDNGKVTVDDATPETSADFVFIGDYDTWVSGHKGESTLEKSILTGKLKFKGSIPKIMMLKSQLLVLDNVARRIPAEY